MKKEKIIFLLIVIIVTLFSGISLGKYLSKTHIEVKSEIAKPIIKMEGDPILNISEVRRNEIYQFMIKNYNEMNQITQVDLEYYIEIISEKNPNIHFKVYKEDKEVKIDNQKTEKFLLQKEKMQEDHYKIEILWDEFSALEVIQDIRIKVSSEQKNK